MAKPTKVKINKVIILAALLFSGLLYSLVSKLPESEQEHNKLKDDKDKNYGENLNIVGTKVDRKIDLKVVDIDDNNTTDGNNHDNNNETDSYNNKIKNDDDDDNIVYNKNNDIEHYNDTTSEILVNKKEQKSIINVHDNIGGKIDTDKKEIIEEVDLTDREKLITLEHNVKSQNDSLPKDLFQWYYPQTINTTYDCPKVYIYENLLAKPFSDIEMDEFWNLERIFGIKNVDGTYITGASAQSQVIIYRILHSKKCRTLNPNEADLFYIPLLPAHKDNGKWSGGCRKMNANVTENEFLKELPYLDVQTADRHFMSTAKFYSCNTCVGWHEPKSILLKKIFRLSYSFPLEKFRRANQKKKPHYWQAKLVIPSRKFQPLTPGVSIIPYTTNIHWSSTDRPKYKINRERLVTYLHGDSVHGDVPVRKRIHKTCYSNRKKKISRHKDNILFCARFEASWAHEEKSNSIFCLEPGGDTPSRKSIMDSIAAGCIPVFFGNLVPNYFYGYYWDTWAKNSIIVINRQKYIEGKINLLQTLSNIPQEKIKKMQSVLFDNAHKFVFNLDDSIEDGFALTLRKLVKMRNNEWPLYGDKYYANQTGVLY